MIYNIHWVLVGTIMRLFFRKIYISGRENLPKDKPLFIVSNHPTGFWEPCIYACSFPFRLHFLTRGDLFQKKAFRWFLEGTNQLPIFRRKDGYSHLPENKNSQSEIVKKLLSGGRIVIFAEGSSGQVRYIRPFKKGMARMSWSAKQIDPNFDLQIVPVGVSFDDFQGFRKNAHIKVGKPIALNDYVPMLQENEPKAILNLTRDAQDALEDLIVSVPDKEVSKLFDQTIEIQRTEFRNKHTWFPVFENTEAPLRAEQALSKTLSNQINNQDLTRRIEGYVNTLEKVATKDGYVSKGKSILFSFLIGLALLPFAILGLIFNFIPTTIVVILTTFIIPRNRFYTSLSGLSRLLIHFYLFYPIMTIILWFKFGWISLLFAPMAILFEWLLFRFIDQLLFIKEKIRLNLFHKGTLNDLQMQRVKLIKDLKIKT